MAIIITDECINCGACEAECPNTAIYEGGIEWTFAEGTKLNGQIRSKKTDILMQTKTKNLYLMIFIT